MAARGRRKGGRKERAAAAAYEAKAEAMDDARHSMEPASLAESLGNESAKVRLTALRRLCPCKLRGASVRDEFVIVWNAIFDLVGDEDDDVRSQVLHTICDGSPASMETRVAEALEDFNRDSNKAIRRQAHKVLASYTRTGKWNIL